MSYIFRLHGEGKNTIIDWDENTRYGESVISQIKDPNGESSTREITSIPSPFARIDLVKTAFAKVVEIAKKTKTLDGKTIHHKMVSDCFDIGQLFFEFDKYKDKLEIVVWDKEADLEKLLKSDNPEHLQLGETYRVFLEQDGKNYNFDRLKEMYLLKYTGNGKKSQMDIIGGTSPATLFFSSANPLDFVSENIKFDDNKPFQAKPDGNFYPLYERDIEYIKFWWALSKSVTSATFGKDFSGLFEEVQAYLKATYEQLNEKTKKIIDKVTAADLDVFEDIPTAGKDGKENSGHPVEALQNLKIKQHMVNLVNIEQESGFVIDSQYTITGHRPLVLPVDTYTHATVYTKKNLWNKTTEVPYKVLDDDGNPIDPANRTLPDEGSKYPYLTISDFLSDTIVCMPYYEINKESFFDGNIDRTDSKSYLLPLTDLFFQCFTAEQLCKDKMFEFKNNAGGITVVLRIPIKNGKHIEYRRTYFEDSEANIEKNQGALIKHDFAFALFPNIKFNSDKEAFYRFGIIPDEFGTNNFSAKYVTNTKVNTVENVRNDNYNDYLQCKNFILENSNFEYLEITCPDGTKGVVIPKFTDCSGKNAGKEQFTFAVDFGTTNTHIEYCKGSQKSQAFDIEEKDKQVHWMSQNLTDLLRLIYDVDFIPETINKASGFKFPTRTALSVARNHKFKNGALPFVQGNIGFSYEKKQNFDYNQMITGLKWIQGDEHPDDQDNENKVKCFIESLCLILHNKVILNKGDLSNTKIVWSYPVSMKGKRLELFEEIWQAAYRKYFGDKLENLISVTESLAPYIYYKEEDSAVSDMVSIDIGGGTTDMVVVVKDQVKFITSFRFAANAILGNGYAKNKINGIITQFLPGIKQTMDELGLRIVNDICQDFLKEKDSANIASFFFSLKDNLDIIKADKKDNTKFAEQLDFQAKLAANSSHKIIFALFYVAIIYHLANLMKSKECKMPRHIAFSGNGSKTTQILTRKSEFLEDFTKAIFEKVYGESYEEKKLTIIQNGDNPKEVTCKGAIVYDPDDENFKKPKIVVLQGIDDKSVFTKEKYADIDQEDYLDKSVEEVKRFLKVFFDLMSDHPEFMTNFGISYESLEIVEKECYNDLKTFASKGLNQKLQEVNIKQPIEETFFFYPLVGLLSALSNEICNSLSSAK